MIVVQELNKTYGDKQVLTNVSFSAESGVVTGFVGPNGAGKSTTMRMIAALEQPDSGIALVDGQPFSKISHPVRTMGVYLGSDYLPNHMTVTEYLSYVCEAGNIDKNNIPSVVNMVELMQAADKPISSYSLGMRQRAGLAAALIGNPTTLMLDEPVNGLDPMGVQWLRGVIRSQADAGKAVLLSSHLLSELELVADNVVMLEQGRVVRMGSMKDLSVQNGPVQVLMHTSNDRKFAAALAKKGYQVQSTGDMILVSGVPPEKLAAAALKVKLNLYHLEEKHASLEEMFMNTAQAYVDATPLQTSQVPQQSVQSVPQQSVQSIQQNTPPPASPPQEQSPGRKRWVK